MSLYEIGLIQMLRVGSPLGLFWLIYEPRCEKTGFLRMRKQSRRSAPLFSLHG